MIKLSICLANTNHSELLDTAITSIYKNPPRCNYEILVVDNFSTDGSAAMVLNKHPQVILTKNTTRLGYPANCNINIQKANGEYLLILNEDVEIQPGSLDIGINFLDQDPGIGLLGCCMYLPNGEIQYTSGRKFPTLLNELLGWLTLSDHFPKNIFFGRYLMSYWAHDTIREVETICEAGMLVRRSAIEQVGMMDENLFFNYDGPEWTQRFIKNKWKVVFHPEVRILHKEGQSSRPGGNVNYFILIESLKSSIYYYKKYHGDYYAFFYRYIMAIIFSLYALKHSTTLLFVKDNNRRSSLLKRRETALLSFLWYSGMQSTIENYWPNI